MGSLASLSKWNPEDDILLKNAVEAGASLESLAKGAVCFSQRFTLKELQDRWHSLVFAPETSSGASTRMLEYEEFATCYPNKVNRACSIKGKYLESRKRKVKSVRSLYYAKRKRIRSKPFESSNRDFAHYSDIANGSIYGCGDQLNLQNQHHEDNIFPAEHILNCHESSQTGYDNEQGVFPEILRFTSNTIRGSDAHPTCHTEHIGSVEDECCPNGIVDRGYLYDFKDNVSLELVDKEQLNNEFLEENLPSFHVSNDDLEDKLIQPLPTDDSCDKDATDTKPLVATSKSENYDAIQENNNTGTHIPGSGDTVHQVGCSSTLPVVPPLGEIRNIPLENMPMDMHLESSGVVGVDANIDKLGCSNMSSNATRGDVISDVGLSSPMIQENDLMDFSSAFMDFSGDDGLMFVDIGEKDTGDSSCLNGLSSIFLSSPSDSHEDCPANSNDPEDIVNLDGFIKIPDGGFLDEASKDSHQVDFLYKNDLIDQYSLQNVPVVSSEVSLSAEHHQGPLICTLNTEDHDIPCNDDFLLPTQTATQFSSPTKSLSRNVECSLGDFGKIVQEQLPNPQPIVSSTALLPSSLPKVGFLHLSNDGRLEAKSFERTIMAGVSGDAGFDANERKACIQPILSHSVAGGSLHGENATHNLEKHCNFDASINPSLDNSAPGHDRDKHYTLIAGGCKPEFDIQGTIENYAPPHSELAMSNLGNSQPIPALSTSDQEVQDSEIEDDVPYFADVEALILDMDLGPYDQESCLFTKEVSLYQPLESRKAMMKLEQGARSFMNRKISVHDSFAVFYGRFMKYFFKKREVLLGRGTSEREVDIDLREEGHVNKISRRQAIFKMEEDGSIFLKNIGKCPIFVNSKEVATKKRILLDSSSLIEIRDFTFMFEVNESAVRQYVARAAAAHQSQVLKFDWLPDEKP
ncbi:uncharacterized protein LOC121992053 isoform X1 [Zingiber officinale]|uniref:FHA domain-containing protein n=1 Tax=Zingiber officinale TaxID=94328 RepID=A0A8J5FU53_ZINOF|nr:uncharacterized protein LOC121992053 isoform X1 [Zingiber officinale]KAG6495045.1 hypothetical protein ZIOFF_042836 [Zingiber officinale]